MPAVHLIALVAGLALAAAAYADDDRQKKKASHKPLPYTPPPKTSPSNENSEYTRPPYRPRTERDYEPWKTNRSSPLPKPAPPKAPKTQAVKNTTKPEPRDPALARCDDFKRRMESVIREEQRGGDPARMQRLGDERRKIYQDELRAGC
jgi:hypothetical protein